ncbi:hypothetical protein [Tenacibaculum sp.]|uniref:hypothetical protein n=1 Tax=Tenacibaculum sp. TaxID=1906242 RepID=UPI003D0AA781
MEEYFKNLKEKEKGNLVLKKGRWWNGNTYMPFYEYTLNYKYKDSEIIFNYEYRQSEFTKPSMIDGGALGDRHICQVSCEVRPKKDSCNFKITERGFLGRILRSTKGDLFKVKCENVEMKEFLLKNQSLYYLYSIVENSPEFSPEILGVKKDKLDEKYFQLKIRYNTQQENKSILFHINEFCKEVSTFWDN